MADNQMDSSLTDGNTQQANAGLSKGDGGEPSSLEADKLQSFLASLDAKIDRLDGQVRSLQGDKDRGVQSVKKEVSGLKEQIAEYEELKERLGNPDAALEQIQLRNDIKELKELLAQGKVSQEPAGNSELGATETAQAFKDAGIDLSNPSAAVLAQRKYNSVAERNAAIVGYLKEQRTAPSPTPAQQAADSGGFVPGSSETLQQAFMRQSAEIAASNLSQDEKQRKLAEIEVEYRAKGMQ